MIFQTDNSALLISAFIKRNQSVITSETTAYIVDNNLTAKFKSIFEQPDKKEIDVWVNE